MATFFTSLYDSTGLPILFADPILLMKTLAMYVIIGALFYLAIVRKFEPLLLLPIAFGMLLANLPGANLFHMDLFIHEDGSPIDLQTIVEQGNLIDFLYLGVKLGIYPSLIFLGVGAMTDFSALIANPKSLMLGAAAQLGVFVAFIGALFLGVVAVVPLLANIISGGAMAGLAFGGSSVIILCGVVLETIREIEAQMTMRHYKGFLE